MRSTILFSFLLINLSFSAKLPDSFKKCKKNDSQCLSEAVADALKQLTKSFPEINLLTLEPVEIPSMTIGAGTSAVNLVQNFKNLKLYGFSDAKDVKFNIDENKKMVTLKCKIPQVKLIGEYDVNGKILLLPVFGKGPITLTLTNVNVEHIFNIEEYEKKGQKHWKVTDEKLTLSPGLVHFKLENLFNGDDRLGDNINNVLNDNWQDVFNDVKDGYETAFGKIVSSLFNNVLAKVPIEKMFIN